MKVEASGLEVKQVLVGIHRYQYDELERIRCKHSATRSEIIREAIDLWLRGYKLKHEAVDDGTNSADD